MYQWLAIRRGADFQHLKDCLEDVYAPESVANFLEQHVSAECAGVLIEFVYVDKDYRSTYYHFYAKKGLRYNAFCVRLHFFNTGVEFNTDTLELLSRRRDLSGHYMGFMVLRPTRVATIGRTIVSTWLMKGFEGSVIGALHKVHVLGNKLEVWGFPWMSQHRDIQVCAHVACWAILRHYSERYHNYAEHLTHDITRMAHAFDPGGLIPSQGLTLLDAERVFANGSTYPIMVRKSDDDDGKFFRQLLAYVESGFPVFAALPNLRHAVAVIGRGPVRDVLKPGTVNEPRHFAADFTDHLIVIDDNYAPYQRIGRAPGAKPYDTSEIATFIVPLPDKVHYPAEAVDKCAVDLAEIGCLGIKLPDGEAPVIRYFLTTAATFTRFIAQNRLQFPRALVSAVLQLPLTQFLWVIEGATVEQWRAHQVSFRALLDATASVVDNRPLFLIHNERRLVVINRAGAGIPLKLDYPEQPYQFGRMPDNLEQSRPLIVDEQQPGATYA